MMLTIAPLEGDQTPTTLCLRHVVIKYYLVVQNGLFGYFTCFKCKGIYRGKSIGCFYEAQEQSWPDALPVAASDFY